MLAHPRQHIPRIIKPDSLMSEAFLRDYPQLKPFVLTNVRLTGTIIGGGAYGKVEEIVIGAATKTIYSLEPAPYRKEGDLSEAEERFVKECLLMSGISHPNIVQFIGIVFCSCQSAADSRGLPALVMERLLTNFHDLLTPESRPVNTVAPLSFFSMALKYSVLHNVASGLSYLHERLPPIIHRDLSARNVLLNSEMVAKIADLWVWLVPFLVQRLHSQ